MASSSKASDSSSQRSKRPDQGMGRDAAAAATVGAIHGKLMQLVRQIQTERLAYIKEKVEVNRKTLQRHTCALFDVAAAAEVSSRGTEGGNALSRRAAELQSRHVESDLANGMGERDVVYVQEENPAAGTLVLSGSGGAAQRTVVRFVKLPLIDRIPPYTTWIFLDNAETKEWPMISQLVGEEFTMIQLEMRLLSAATAMMKFQNQRKRNTFSLRAKTN